MTALATPFTELVGCTVPIQLAPMGGVPTPALIAAVTGAGGMGGFGAGPMPATALEATLAEIAEAGGEPLAVNVLVPFLDLGVVKVAAAGARMVDFYHGAPDRALVDLVHEAGALAGWQVGSVTDAVAAAEAGCDLVVVRGIEGGGRMHGHESLGPLLADVVAAIDAPVLAAGGIGDGHGLAAALTAGAAGVRMGTRFLAARESAAHPAYRDAVIAAGPADTVLTEEFREGWPDPVAWSRVLRRSLDAARAFDGDVVGELHMGPIALPLPRFGIPPPLATSTGHVEAMPMYAGESVRFVHGIEDAGDIVRAIAAEAESLLRPAAG